MRQSLLIKSNMKGKGIEGRGLQINMGEVGLSPVVEKQEGRPGRQELHIIYCGNFFNKKGKAQGEKGGGCPVGEGTIFSSGEEEEIVLRTFTRRRRTQVGKTAKPGKIHTSHRGNGR